MTQPNNYALAVAQAVLNKYWHSPTCVPLTDLETIIAAVPRPEPYCWKVDGVREPFFGEYAEIEAKHEAKRIGGTCKAFPLYAEQPAPSEPVNALSDLSVVQHEIQPGYVEQPLPELSDDRLYEIQMEQGDGATYGDLMRAAIDADRELRAGK